MANHKTAKNGTSCETKRNRNYIEVKGDQEEHYIKIYDSVNNDYFLSANAFRIYAKMMQFINIGKITDKMIYNSLKMNYRTYARYKKELIKSGYLQVCKENKNNYQYYIKRNKDLLYTKLDIENLEKYRIEDLERYFKSRESTEEEKQILKKYLCETLPKLINTKW